MTKSSVCGTRVLQSEMHSPVADVLILSIMRHISLREVSAPSEKFVPGTLLLIVHGITHIGMRNCMYLSRFWANSRHVWNACKKWISHRRVCRLISTHFKLQSALLNYMLILSAARLSERPQTTGGWVLFNHSGTSSKATSGQCSAYTGSYPNSLLHPFHIYFTNWRSHDSERSN